MEMLKMDFPNHSSQGNKKEKICICIKSLAEESTKKTKVGLSLKALKMH